jgi:hypothetical protein
MVQPLWKTISIYSGLPYEPTISVVGVTVPKYFARKLSHTGWDRKILGVW